MLNLNHYKTEVNPMYSYNSQKAVKEVTEKIIFDNRASNFFIGNQKKSHNYRHHKEPQRMKNDGITDRSVFVKVKLILNFKQYKIRLLKSH